MIINLRVTFLYVVSRNLRFNKVAFFISIQYKGNETTSIEQNLHTFTLVWKQCTHFFPKNPCLNAPKLDLSLARLLHHCKQNRATIFFILLLFIPTGCQEFFPKPLLAPYFLGFVRFYSVISTALSEPWSFSLSPLLYLDSLCSNCFFLKIMEASRKSYYRYQSHKILFWVIENCLVSQFSFAQWKGFSCSHTISNSSWVCTVQKSGRYIGKDALNKRKLRFPNIVLEVLYDCS